MEKQKKGLEMFSREELETALTLADVEALLTQNKALTPYHYEILKIELQVREDLKTKLAEGMYKNGKLIQTKKTNTKRLELLKIFQEQAHLQNLQTKAKRLYFEFKKMRAENSVPPELGQLFRETLDKLWSVRRSMQQKAQEQNIEANLDAFLDAFNKQHHAV